MLKFSVAFCFIVTFAVVFTFELDEVVEEFSFEENNNGKIYGKFKNGTALGGRAEYMAHFRNEDAIYLLSGSSIRYWARLPDYTHRSNPFTAEVRLIRRISAGPIAAKFTDGQYAYELDINSNLRKYTYKPGFNEDLMPSKEPLIEKSGVHSDVGNALGSIGTRNGQDYEIWSSYLNSRK